MQRSFVSHLVCMICGNTYAPQATLYTCPAHGDEGILEVVYDYTALAAEPYPGIDFVQINVLYMNTRPGEADAV